MNPSCQQGPVQAGDGSIMLWGIFMWHGLGRNNWPVTTVSLLHDHLHPFMNSKYPKNDDSSRIRHHFIVARDYQWLVWPPCLPSFKPIKHLLDVVEWSICTQNPAPTNIKKLWTAIKVVQVNSPVFFWPLVESIPHQVVTLCWASLGHLQYKAPVPCLFACHCE